MNKSQYGMVVNSHGYIIGLVLVNNHLDEYEPIDYILKNNEVIICNNIETALSMHKPRWTSNQWEETATKEELEELKPTPIPQEPTETEVALLEMSMMLAQQDQVNQELSQAVAEISMVMAEMIGGIANVQ